MRKSIYFHCTVSQYLFICAVCSGTRRLWGAQQCSSRGNAIVRLLYKWNYNNICIFIYINYALLGSSEVSNESIHNSPKLRYKYMQPVPQRDSSFGYYDYDLRLYEIALETKRMEGTLVVPNEIDMHFQVIQFERWHWHVILLEFHCWLPRNITELRSCDHIFLGFSREESIKLSISSPAMSFQKKLYMILVSSLRLAMHFPLFSPQSPARLK